MVHYMITRTTTTTNNTETVRKNTHTKAAKIHKFCYVCYLQMSLLMTIVVVHFAISIATDVVVGMYAGMGIMLFVCQLFFILWGLFLFFGYAYIFRRLYVHAVKRQKNVVQNNGSVYGGGGGLAKPKARFTLSVAVTVSLCVYGGGLVGVGAGGCVCGCLCVHSCWTLVSLFVLIYDDYRDNADRNVRAKAQQQ